MNIRTSRIRTRGIALIDLSIATLIGGAVLGSTMTMLSGHVELERERATQRAIEAARDALTGYAQMHRRLPCPANPNLPSTDSRAGFESARNDGKCEGGYFGALPWMTLGLPELDAWGMRFSYRVARDLADGANECVDPSSADVDCLRLPTRSPSYVASADALAIKEVRDPSGSRSAGETIAHGAAAVVVSHGPNGSFGYARTGVKRGASPLATTHEADNANPNTLTFFVRTVAAAHPVCRDASTSAGSCVLDDSLGWLTRGDVLTAIVKAGHRR